MHDVDDLIKGCPPLKGFLTAWDAHLKADNSTGAAVLANLFMETLKNPDPESASLRLAFSAIANMLSLMKWPAMHAAMKPHLSDTDGAELFYKRFRNMVLASINDYYEPMADGVPDLTPVDDPDPK